jgi:hypothetical protein
MKKILKANCEQLHLLESALMGTGCMSLVARGDNVKLWEVQTQFKPIVTIRKYELICRETWPVSLTFEFHDNEGYGHLLTNRKGIEILKSLMPDTFAPVSLEDDGKQEETEIDVKPYTKFKPKPA